MTINEEPFQYHAFTKLVVFQLPEQQLYQRNNIRELAVPKSVLQRQIQKFEFPYMNDAHQTLFVNAKGYTIT